MFASSDRDHVAASVLANDYAKMWENTLALRVSLQKPLDTAGQLPSDNEPISQAVCDQLRSRLAELSLVTELVTQKSERKRKLVDDSKGRTIDEEWEHIISSQSDLQSSKWEPTLNKWHARLNFGSEATKAKLKVFTQTMWDQVEGALRDEQRSVAKSRMPLQESRRPGRPLPGETANHEYDLEVFDDRMFYSMLLKTFITSAAAGAGQQQAGLAGTLRASDLEALRQYKRKKLNVDRKASKGRKVRYNVHDKLQNFMFPQQRYVSSSGSRGGGDSQLSTIDADRLFQSLFQ